MLIKQKSDGFLVNDFAGSQIVSTASLKTRDGGKA
jgi:hypothetical protein